jgi:PEGA domain-containing protein
VAIIRIARFWPVFPKSSGRVAPAPFARGAKADGLDAFGSESSPPLGSVETKGPALKPAPQPESGGGGAPKTALKWAAVIILTAAAALAGAWQYQRWAGARAGGVLTLETTPAGADVMIGGAPAGKTPLTVPLAAGDYDVRLVGPDGQKRDLRINIAGGAAVLRHMEFAAAAPVAPVTGSLHVQTDPAHLPVSVDGIDRGTSPLTISALPAGEHHVLVRSDRGALRRTVRIQAGEAVSLVISPVESATVVPGWLAVRSPITMQLREDGKLIGTTETERLMLPAGEHAIEIVNEPLGYRALRRITVGGGKTTAFDVELPSGSLSLNAIPWAEVFVDGERVGETPIANLSRRIGSHEVVFRHPQLGERRETIVVTTRQPARLGVDMRKK